MLATIGMVRVEAETKLLDRWFDLHCRNGLNSVVQCCVDIGPAARTEDQRVMERITWEDLVYAPVERFLVLPGNHRLVPSSIVHINDIATWSGGGREEAVVCRPARAAPQSPHHVYSPEENHPRC